MENLWCGAHEEVESMPAIVMVEDPRFKFRDA
jgi:hypothetical protein